MRLTYLYFDEHAKVAFKAPRELLKDATKLKRNLVSW